MDPKLAEMYGTNQPTEADLEKLAAAELAEGLADEGQIDLDNVSEEDLEAMAASVLNGDEEEASQGDPAEEAQEKLAEADYLGRVMAHSFHQEMRGIEKTEGKGTAVAKEIAKMTRKGEGHVSKMSLGRRAMDKVRGAYVGRRQAYNAAGTDLKQALKGKIEGIPGKAGKLNAGERLRSAGSAAWKVAPELVAGGAVAGGAGYAAKKHMEKKSSALDTLVESRAAEILEASGINPETLEPMEQEKTSAPANEILASAVEQRAWEMLDELGFQPQEVEQEQE